MMTEDQQRRLMWRCRRGMLELDLMLARWVKSGVSMLTPAAEQTLERLLDLPDTRLLNLLLALETTDDLAESELLQEIRAYATHKTDFNIR